MLAGLFRSNQPAILLAVPLLVIILMAPVLSVPWEPAASAMPLQGLLEDLARTRSWMPGVLSIVLVMLLSLQLTALSGAAELLERKGQWPALLFPLVFATFAREAPLDAALAGMPLVVMALQRAWSMTNTGAALRPLFDAGLLLGVAALFYLPYTFLVVVLWASASVIRPFKWREYVVPLLACALAFYLAWAVLYLAGATPWRPLHTIAGTMVPGVVAGSAQRILLYLLLGGMLLVSLWSFADGYQRGVMREKNLRSSFMAFQAALLVIIGFEWMLNRSFPPVLIAAPLGVFLSHALQGTRRKWLGESAVMALLLLGLWVQWGR
jgi:hypothetical protein